MAEFTPGKETIEQRSAVGAAIGYEFECSFGAAAANKAAQARIEVRNQLRADTESYYRGERVRRENKYYPPMEYENIQLLGNEAGTRVTEVIQLEDASLQAEQPVRLALIQQRRAPKKEIGSRMKLLRHFVFPPEAPPPELDDPVLVALFDDIALPLAAFARRKNGQCSYVQIGSEIKDDNFHVLASDDLTGRNTIIEAVRDVLDEERGGDKRLAGRKGQALQKLLDVEFSQHREELTSAFEAQLVRKCMGQLSEKHWRRLLVMDNEGAPSEDRFKFTPIVDRTRLSDGRIATMAIAAPSEGPNQDIGYLMAVNRDIVVIPVATLNASTGQLQFESADLEPGSDKRKQLVYQLLSLLRGEPLVVHDSKPAIELTVDGTSPEPAKSDKRRKTAERIRSVFAKRQIGKALERQILKHAPSEVDEIIAYIFSFNRAPLKHFLADEEVPTLYHNARWAGEEGRVRQELHEYDKNPLTTPNPYPDSRILKVVTERIEVENSARAELLDQFNVQKRFVDLLGPTTLEEEALVKTLYDMRLSSNVHLGVIKNERINNTDVPALLQVEINREDRMYSVTVSGKPVDMEDEPLKTLPVFCFDFDVTKPVYAQLNGARAHLDELLDKFKLLSPVK